jgi:hypothetical protein
VDYIALQHNAELPALSRPAPFKTVLIADLEWDHDAQYLISDWLLGAGCVYFMVTGKHSAGWKQMLDATNLARAGFGTIPDKDVIIATEHAGERLSDIFWFSRYSAMHPLAELNDLLCVHICAAPNEAEVRAVCTEGE